MKNIKEDVRRRALAHVIQTRFEGNQSAYARAAGKKQQEISDMLKGRKAFGEKVARKMEAKAALPPGILDLEPDEHSSAGGAARERPDLDSGVSDVRSSYHGVKISLEGALVGAEWEKLDAPLRAQISELIDTLVAYQVRATRETNLPPNLKKRPKRSDSRPRPSA